MMAQDDNSGVVAIGCWSRKRYGEPMHLTRSHRWILRREAAFIFTGNQTTTPMHATRQATMSEPYPFIIDPIDKHSPVIDSVEWDKGWSGEKTNHGKSP